MLTCEHCGMQYGIKPGFESETLPPMTIHTKDDCRNILAQRDQEQRDFVIRYINAMGPHMEEAWKEAFIKAFDLEVDKGNPYQPVSAKKA